MQITRSLSRRLPRGTARFNGYYTTHFKSVCGQNRRSSSHPRLPASAAAPATAGSRQSRVLSDCKIRSVTSTVGSKHGRELPIHRNLLPRTGAVRLHTHGPRTRTRRASTSGFIIPDRTKSKRCRTQCFTGKVWCPKRPKQKQSRLQHCRAYAEVRARP